jgi:signal transduction histidine kinase
VEIGLARADGAAEITVADTGIGIEPAEVERIFEPFHRLEAARAHDTGGAGLGLAIARTIVIAHGGAIAVESAPGAGSRFTVRLPVV